MRIGYACSQSVYRQSIAEPIRPGQGRESFFTASDLLEEVATDLEGWGLVKEMLGWHQRENQVFSRQPLYYYEHHYSSHTRFHLTSVIVVEATLAGMEVLSRLPDGWPGRVVLLIANASEVRLWPSAILDRIDSVFWKQEDNFLPALRQVCLTHHLAVCERLARLLRFTTAEASFGLLERPGFFDAVFREMELRNWDEYLFVGAPMGFWGCSFDGPLEWLQLETPESLDALAIASRERGYSKVDVERVEDGQGLTPFQFVDMLAPSNHVPLVQADVLMTAPPVYCALSELQLKYHSGETEGFR